MFWSLQLWYSTDYTTRYLRNLSDSFQFFRSIMFQWWELEVVRFEYMRRFLMKTLFHPHLKLQSWYSRFSRMMFYLKLQVWVLSSSLSKVNYFSLPLGDTHVIDSYCLSLLEKQLTWSGWVVRLNCRAQLKNFLQFVWGMNLDSCKW